MTEIVLAITFIVIALILWMIWRALDNIAEHIYYLWRVVQERQGGVHPSK